MEWEFLVEQILLQGVQKPPISLLHRSAECSFENVPSSFLRNITSHFISCVSAQIKLSAASFAEGVCLDFTQATDVISIKLSPRMLGNFHSTKTPQLFLSGLLINKSAELSKAGGRLTTIKKSEKQLGLFLVRRN